MRWRVRRLIWYVRLWRYKKGHRPKRGSIFFSPTLHIAYTYKDEGGIRTLAQILKVAMDGGWNGRAR